DGRGVRALVLGLLVDGARVVEGLRLAGFEGQVRAAVDRADLPDVIDVHDVGGDRAARVVVRVVHGDRAAELPAGVGVAVRNRVDRVRVGGPAVLVDRDVGVVD